MSIILLLLFFLSALVLLINSNSGKDPEKAVHIRGTVAIDYTDLYAVCLMLFFSLLCATRSMDSYDTNEYFEWYNKIIAMPFFQTEGSYGIVFEMTSKCLGLVCRENFRLFLFFLVLLNNLVVYRVFRRTEVGVSGYVLYVFLLGFYYNFAVLRQGLAITFVIWAFAAWKNKKKLFALLVIAVLSHNTAVMVLLVAALVHVVQFRKRTMLVLWFVALINYITRISDRVIGQLLNSLGRFIPQQMSGRYALYFLDSEIGGSFSFYYLVYFAIIFILILWAYSERRQEQTAIRMIENRRMLNIGTIGTLLLSVGSVFTVIVRLTDYMIPICIMFLLPVCLQNRPRTNRIIAIFALCVIAMVLYLRIFLNKAPLYFV